MCSASTGNRQWTSALLLQRVAANPVVCDAQRAATAGDFLFWTNERQGHWGHFIIALEAAFLKLWSVHCTWRIRIFSFHAGNFSAERSNKDFCTSRIHELSKLLRAENGSETAPNVRFYAPRGSILGSKVGREHVLASRTQQERVTEQLLFCCDYRNAPCTGPPWCVAPYRIHECKKM